LVDAFLPLSGYSSPLISGATFAEELRVASAAAVAGGRAAAPFYGSGRLETEEKAPGDPVTAADHASNRSILAVLREAFPGDPVLSEESRLPEGRGACARLWVVDPLDGTKEFIAQNGEFSVMVGLAVRGEAVLGAVFMPDPGRLFLGIAGQGAWSADCPIGHDADRPASLGRLLPLCVPRRTSPSLRLIRSRSHPDPLLQQIERDLGEVQVIPSGSVGVKCARVADGDADLYVHPVAWLKEWDTCAPEAVLRGAGGRVTDCGGLALTYGKNDPRQPRGIFAASQPEWERLLPLVREVAQPLLSEPNR
jgi:3'(2'), 5'-bisphosphate nucleotidase